MPKAVNGIKQCSMCKETKPVSRFSNCPKNPDGLKYRCRQCAYQRKKQNNVSKPYVYLIEHNRYYFVGSSRRRIREVLKTSPNLKNNSNNLVKYMIQNNLSRQDLNIRQIYFETEEDAIAAKGNFLKKHYNPDTCLNKPPRQPRPPRQLRPPRQPRPPRQLRQLRLLPIEGTDFYGFVIKSSTHGSHTVLIDPEDFEKIKHLGVWYIRKLGSIENPKLYAEKKLSPKQRTEVQKIAPGLYINKSGCLTLHQIIMSSKQGQDVDHINHNGLDNRKHNLRLCTRSQNCQNRRLKKDSRSGFKGVYEYRQKIKKRYNAYIKPPDYPKNSSLSIGYYSTAEEAARAYDKAAIEYFGEFANLNFPVDA